MKLNELDFLVKNGWSKETCDKDLRDDWSENNPALGQSLVTSLAVNDFMGGEILICFSSTGAHYYNVINDRIVDLTYKQFGGESIIYNGGVPFSKDALLEKEDCRDRYLLFLNNIRENINKLNMEVDDTFDKNKIR